MMQAATQGFVVKPLQQETNDNDKNDDKNDSNNDDDNEQLSPEKRRKTVE